MSSTGAWRRKRDYEETLKHLSRGKTSNVQHRTPNAEVSENSSCHSMFGVGCSMLDVPLGSWRAPFRFSACTGTMNQIGTPLPALSPQGGERVAEGRERGGSWRAPFRFSACIGTMNQLGTPLPALARQGGGRRGGVREV